MNSELPENSNISISLLKKSLELEYTSDSYKPFWLWAIVSIIYNTERTGSHNNFKLELDNIAIRMLTFGWIYTHDYNLNIVDDELCDIAREIASETSSKHNLQVKSIEVIIKNYLKEYPNIKNQILRSVPYDYLTPFYEEDLSRVSDELRNKKIIELSMRKRTIYCIDNNRCIIISPKWYTYFSENYAVIINWINEILESILKIQNGLGQKNVFISRGEDLNINTNIPTVVKTLANKNINLIVVPKQFHSLTVRLKSIYGNNFSIKDLYRIKISEFTNTKGIGTTYGKRLIELRKYLSDDCNIKYISETINQNTLNEGDLERSALFRKIKECFPFVKVANDILSITPEDFSTYSGVGRGKVQQLIKWQSILSREEPVKAGKPIFQEDSWFLDELVNYRFFYLHLSNPEGKLLKKLKYSNCYTGGITPLDIYKIDIIESSAWDGIGKTYCDILSVLQIKIRESLLNNNCNSILIHNKFGEMLTLQELAPLIKEDLENFHNTLSGNNEIIWSSRLGYLIESLTLQEIGEKLSISRERVRQIEAKLIKKFLRSIRIHPLIIKKKIENKTRTEFLDELEVLREVFHNDNDLFSIIALISDQDVKEFMKKYNPPVNNHILDSFIAFTPFPVKKQDVMTFLQEELNGTKQEIDIYLSTMVNSNIVRIEGDLVLPVALSKELAIAHILSRYPKGLDWKEIAMEVNESGVCHTTLSMERPDPNLTFSSYFYQSDQRIYSHIQFYPISKDKIKSIILNVKNVLQQSKYKSMNLMTEYYSSLSSPAYDYYTIRHAVRNYGETCGLYFNGKSQSDTVSLNPDPQLISQKEAIRRLLIENERPITVQEVTKIIKSQSESHARLYLEELMFNGDVVNVGENKYQLRGKAFIGIDIKKALNSIFNMLNDDYRIHHISVITYHMNKLFGYDYPNRFWRSFMVSYSNDMEWYVKSMLVSLKEIPINGLLDLVREHRGKSREDIIGIIQQKVCISSEVIGRAINNDDLKLFEKTDDNKTEGLASDIMEELFSL